jgi:hypothetical protein
MYSGWILWYVNYISMKLLKIIFHVLHDTFQNELVFLFLS